MATSYMDTAKQCNLQGTKELQLKVGLLIDHGVTVDQAFSFDIHRDFLFSYHQSFTSLCPSVCLYMLI
jgi:hypothetical protein